MKTLRSLPVAGLTVGSICGRSPHNKIPFNVPKDQKADHYEVYTINVDGSAMKNVTNHKNVAWT